MSTTASVWFTRFGDRAKVVIIPTWGWPNVVHTSLDETGLRFARNVAAARGVELKIEEPLQELVASWSVP